MPSVDLLQHSSSQKGEHDLVMPDECVPLPPFTGGPIHHVDRWTVVLEEIHVDRGEMVDLMAQISGKAEGLKEYLWKDDCRSQVEVDPTL